MAKQVKSTPYKVSMVFGGKPIPPEEELKEFDRFGILLKESQKFCKRVGLQKDLILKILKTDSDWAFILKVDALLESAAKHIIHHGLQIQLLNRIRRSESLHEFIDTLSMNGRTSLLKLLHAAGLPDDELEFVEVTRLVRNAYAHNIEYADLNLVELIKSRKDKSRLVKHLSAMKEYDEVDLLASVTKDPMFLRFCIIDSTMRFLLYGYHLTATKRRRSR